MSRFGVLLPSIGIIIAVLYPSVPLKAQEFPSPPPNRNLLPPPSALPETRPDNSLPPPDQLLPPIEEDTRPPQGLIIEGKVPLKQCIVVGSSVFEQSDFEQITQRCAGQSLSFTELLEIRSAITDLYVDAGYQTSGAYIPPQIVEDGVVKIQVLEGRLEKIQITGNRRLKSFYIRQRIRAKLGNRPLNTNRLLEALQLLQLNVLVDTISAELLTGTRPGTSLLNLEIAEAQSRRVDINLNNGRSPTVGSFERKIQFSEDNLLGFGDGVFISVANTTGSNQIQVGYDAPVNGKDGRISASFSQTWSEVVDSTIETDAVQFAGNSRSIDLGFRQPLIRRPNQEFALGIGVARRESETIIRTAIDCDFFAVNAADIVLDRPERCLIQPTKVTELLISQDWLQRWRSSVLALRSEFVLGVDVVTQASAQDDIASQFLSWRGQGQWIKRLGRDSLFLSRVNAQISDGALVSIEQFGLGGLNSVRGYRQDLELVDSGVFVSAETRVPIFRGFGSGILQVVPFVDAGHGWSFRPDTIESTTMAALGLGLRWEWSDRISAQFNWGVPLLPVAGLQDSGIESSQFFFSISGQPF
ncbi:MAG: ShlB/FhaC/HecB family hemolysin secretion/activation protein [Cyanobacteria bacterium P01_F01_bin.42]